MRPLRLEVEGYTCYRDRQPPLDFSELSLFAIAGPTGAGKSSILDTMLYALFGKVPRIGKHDISEFISHGRDSMSVALDFRVRSSVYRVTRLSKLSKSGLKSEATLAEITNGIERSIADQIRPVNDAIVSLLGLGYDEFIQTVVLPQGEFAKFLKAKPTDQRAILQHLLRHDVFTRMRDLAEERRREINAELRGLDGQLVSYVAATEESLATSEAMLADARARQFEAGTEKDVADTVVQDARRCRALTQEVEKLRSQRDAVEADATNMERARVELENARRASAIKPRLEAFRDATTKMASAQEVHQNALGVNERASRVRNEAAERSKAAIDAARECDDLSLRVRRLDEISGDIERRADLTARLRSMPEQLEAADGVLRTSQDVVSAERQKAHAEESRLHDLRTAYESIAFDGDLLRSLEATVEQVFRARALQEEITALTADAKERTKARDAAETGAARAESAHRTAHSDAESSAEALRHARAALEDGRNRDRAAALRAHLHTGDACPVCMQTVAVLPADEAPPALARLEKACKEAEERGERAGVAKQTAAEALAKASAKRDEAGRAKEVATAKAADRASDLARLFDAVSSIVPGAKTAGDGPSMLAWMERRRGELRAARTELDRQQAEIHKSAANLAKMQLTLAAAEATVTRASDRREQVVKDQTQLQTDIAAVTARIQAVSLHADPRAERSELERRITTLRDAARTSAETMTRATVAATKAEEQLKAAEASFTQTSAHHSSTQAALTQALTDAGFDNSDAAAKALRSVPQERALEAQIAGFDEKRAGLIRRLADLEPEIAGKEISPELLQEEERRSKAAIEAYRAADQAVTKLDGDCARLRDAVKERTRLLAAREALQRTFAITAELATDLRGDRFQEYLLEEAFKTLVASASVRMKAISNRYTLEWDDGEFYVVDHDNAGERRRAETLSGGETFMASLCLALQLSDEVLRTSGALQMDSLFIDEGFGTLDSDSLSEVTDAMEALRQEGGRMIGVISHRPELTDRLPGCIRVEKGKGESHWVLERVG